MLKVHHLNNSRSQRILWLLEELGTPYEIVKYQRMSPVPFAPPELKNIHPLGKSPVITDNGKTIAESGAIVEYLIDTYGKGKLKPKPPATTRWRSKYETGRSSPPGIPTTMPPLSVDRLLFRKLLTAGTSCFSFSALMVLTIARLPKAPLITRSRHSRSGKVIFPICCQSA